MKEEILKLRADGKSYNEIKSILNCSKGTIAYHCGKGQKDKYKKNRNRRRENILLAKTDGFKYTPKKDVKPDKKNDKNKKDVVESIRKFQKRDNNVNGRINKDINVTFIWEDILEKFGENTICYLSGEKINLFKNNYNLDHIIPASRRGENTLDNLGILHETVNSMKHNLTPEELIEWCIKILKFNNYSVTKNK
jgi:CRISPR/Cas system Type II protein with McrA/HNH and RuvC-like nuclease domain